jgi:hypothetical protein
VLQAAEKEALRNSRIWTSITGVDEKQWGKGQCNDVGSPKVTTLQKLNEAETDERE